MICFGNFYYQFQGSLPKEKRWIRELAHTQGGGRGAHLCQFANLIGVTLDLLPWHFEQNGCIACNSDFSNLSNCFVRTWKYYYFLSCATLIEYTLNKHLNYDEKLGYYFPNWSWPTVPLKMWTELLKTKIATRFLHS